MTLDLNKPIQTRDGRKARIICTDLDSSYGPVVAVVRSVTSPYGHEEEQTYLYTSSGTYTEDDNSDLDLINVPFQRKRWFNIYEPKNNPIGLYGNFPTRKAADECESSFKRVACICIEYEDGEGL